MSTTGKRVAARQWMVHATVLRVIDGDTLSADLDLGWNVHVVPATVRVAGIDCPEMNTAAGRRAADRAKELLAVGTEVTVLSHSRDRYGRVLAAITLPDTRDLAAVLIAEGHGVPYDGGTRKG